MIGLTGGIGSGKSVVAGMFRELGAAVIDADLVARQVVEPGQPALAELVRDFGAGILDAAGRLDRKRLGELVFASPEARKKLNAITHPRIAAETARQTAELFARGEPVVLYEAALLVENGMHRTFGDLIVVSAPREVQLARVMARDGLGRDEAAARLDAQLPLDRKLEVATYVIDNAGSLDDTRRQVEATWRRIRAQETP